MYYTLMHKDIPVFDFESEDNKLYALYIDYAINELHVPLPIEVDDTVVNRSHFNDWLSDRRIPASRDKLQSGLDKLRAAAGGDRIATDTLLKNSLALSLSDQYWVRPKDSSLTWNDVNFFNNDFSDDVGAALFDIDIQTHNADLMSPVNSSDGVLRKKWKIINNERYLIKSGTEPYLQEVFNEKIASLICHTLNIQSYTDYDIISSNNKPASICRCFIDSSTELITANDILEHFLPNTRISPYEHYIKCCERLGADTGELTKSLDDLLTVDYIMGNTDRHLRNFGLIRNADDLSIHSAAPIFDTGAALGHNLLSSDIAKLNDIDAKPFGKTHDEQIRLIKEPERYDISKLYTIQNDVKEILCTGNYLPNERISAVLGLIENRIKRFDKALCKRYTTGINFDTLDMTNSSIKRK